MILNYRGPLPQKYGNRVMHDTSCCFDSLSKFIVNGLWMWPTDKSESFEQNQSKLCEVQIDGEDREDWVFAANKSYNCRDTQCAVRDVKPIEFLGDSWFGFLKASLLKGCLHCLVSFSA